MFRLEKLEISGFKSFADRTSLVFGEGITGVVGPNGCGKSNIAEAISWVLGEQSAKNLRGGKMEDVIFNGTRDRKPTGLAEVLLTMVAIEDIAAHDAEDPEQDDEQEYEQALTSAEHAADAARSLVEELAPEPATEESVPVSSSSPETEQADAAPVESEAGANTEVQSSASVQEPSSSAPLEIKPQSEAEASVKEKPKRKRVHHPRKRRVIAISAGERVTVGRRLYRTGDSDYLMNGRPCLLRDVQDLFAGTGLGGAHYAIIEQGRIGQILSSKPLDRRALIEEAAGITKFKSRKRATELRLESAKQNLTRLNDIITEVERQVNSLKRQAQKSRRYRRLREEMRSLLKIIFTADYYRLNEAIERIARELQEAASNQSQLDARLRERESEYRAAAATARSAEDQLTELRERAAAVELEADRARNRRAFDEQQIKELTARIEELNRDQQALEERLTLLDAENQRRAAGLQSLEAEAAAEQTVLLSREGAYQEALGLSRDAESEIEQMRQRMLAEIGNTERLRNLSASLEESLRKLELKQASLRSEFARATARRDEASSEFERVGGEAETGAQRFAVLAARIAESGSELEALRGETAELRARLDAVHARRDGAQHRLASLEDLDAHHAYYSDAVQQVLSTEHAARINALGTLADFVEVEPQYERLIESLFARELQSVLVPTIDDALTGIEYIKNEGLGRSAFLVVGLHGGEEDSDGDGDSEPESGRHGDEATSDNWSTTSADDHAAARRFDEESKAPRFQLEVLRAIDLLVIRAQIKTVVERAFPDKCSASVVPDIEAALHLSVENPSLIYVTFEGEQVVNGRLIITGAQAGQKNTSLLGLKREIKELREQTQAIAEEERGAAAELETAQQRLRTAEYEAALLDQQLREHEKSAAARTSQMEGLERDLERASQHVRVVDAEIEQTATERDELKSRAEQVAFELAAAELSRDELQSLLNDHGSRLAELRARVEALSQELSSTRASVAARTERLQAARSEMRRAESEAEELRSRINRNRLEMYDSHGRIDSIIASLEEGAAAATRTETERASLAEKISGGSDALASARAHADELEKTLSELREATSAAHDRRGQIEVERARIESETQHLTRACFSELAMSIEDVVTSVGLSGQLAVGSTQLTEGTRQGADDGSQQTEDSELPTANSQLPTDADASRARYEELRVKLDEMGPVNMMALEELEEADERFKFLSEQRRDILDSIRMTEEALSEIKRRSRERFRHAFTHINENFQRMFVELFGGGRGEMTLIDEDDVLESGIDLIAQPPGKRLQNVLLLSGGEKAMAAIALVLAIFQYRPSPFCILDEVDAPLDEVNVARFAEKVIEMSHDTQFLMITHNKRTMEAARALYGVTMEEPGVSKLVSVKFE